MPERDTRLEAVVRTLGNSVHFLESDGETFRSTYNILKDLAEVWGELDESKKSSIYGRRSDELGSHIYTLGREHLFNWRTELDVQWIGVLLPDNLTKEWEALMFGEEVDG